MAYQSGKPYTFRRSSDGRWRVYLTAAAEEIPGLKAGTYIGSMPLKRSAETMARNYLDTARFAAARRENPGAHQDFGERSTAPQQRSKKLPKKAAERFKAAHWGIEAQRTHDFPDEVHMPKKLVEMGKLIELRIDTTGESQGKKKGTPDAELGFARSDTYGDSGCHLAFTTTDDERVYPVLDKPTKAQMRDLIDPEGMWFDLGELADMAGGRQCDYSYPRIDVQCLGVCTDVVYATEKQGDGKSEYIHAFGEESGIKPLLAVDDDGGLWLAGGNYTVPAEGITD